MNVRIFVIGWILCCAIPGFAAFHSPDSSIQTVYFFEPEDPTPPAIKKNMTCRHLHVDQSCMVISSSHSSAIRFLYASMECEKCSLQSRVEIAPLSSNKTVLNFASLGSVWEVVDDRNYTICRDSKYLGENSWYRLLVNKTGCSLECEKEPENIYYPIGIAVVVYMLIAVLCILGDYIRRKEILNRVLHRNSVDLNTDLAAAYSSDSSQELKKPEQKKRLQSLDTVRGLSVIIMIFVNYGGGKYTFLHHSKWNGLNVADLVFPWFMWMMGMSMAISMRSLLRKAIPRKKIFFKILKRSVILFSLGIMLNTYCQRVDLHELRIPGVLQRFGLTYFIVATVHLFYAVPNEAPSSSIFQDLTPFGGEWLIMCTFLVAHILLMVLVHAPDCPGGYFGPGGDHDGGAYSLCTGGAAGYVDRMLLGSSHLYKTPSFQHIYNTTLPYDPEGILGYFTSVFLVFLGLQAGKILLTYKEWKPRVTRWMVWSLLTGIAAAILCLGSKNDGYIPVNKNLWSVSFIFATGSLAFALLSICYILIDVKHWWSGSPFFYAGMNPIFLYVGHEMVHSMFPWSWQVPSTHMAKLFQDLWGTTLWVIISVWMFHKKIFFSL